MSYSSDLYKRSISDRYRKYFMQSSEMTRNYSRYSISEKRFEAPSSVRPWEEGCSGVPMFWDPSYQYVYCDHLDNHTLVIGPTGSKKSRLVAMPQAFVLGAAGENMIITDPKAEIYRRTAAYLERQGYRIQVLNLRNPNLGDMWNPLIIPYRYYCAGDVDRAYEFVNDIAQNMVCNEQNVSDPFWNNSAASFFFGLTILLFKYCYEHNLSQKDVTMQNVIALRYNLLSQAPGEAKEHPSVLWRYAKTDPIILNNLVGTVETAEDTRSGIVSTFDQKMRMFSIQPNLMEMLSGNTIDFDIISENPTVIFLVLPDEKTGYHSIGSLFIKQSYEYLIYLAQNKTNSALMQASLQRRMNYIIDEFASLPAIHDFPALITAARSRNIRFTLIIQSKHQLIQRYKEEADTIMTNCTNWIVLTCRENSFLKELSELCGKTSESNPVVTPDSIQRLNKDSGEALLISGRNRPFITHLPDIEKYDKGDFLARNIEARLMETRSEIVFFEEEERLEREKRRIEREKLFERFRNRDNLSAVNGDKGE